MIDDWSLLELAGTYTEEQAERHREAIAASERASEEDVDDLLERQGIDVE